jgi:hypothetical protein
MRLKAELTRGDSVGEMEASPAGTIWVGARTDGGAPHREAGAASTGSAVKGMNSKLAAAKTNARRRGLRSMGVLLSIYHKVKTILGRVWFPNRKVRISS